MRGDGDGWCVCAAGHRHWGLHGAAGLLVRVDGRVLLQHRAEWSHHGGTWGLPGGARDSHESVPDAALREADEEVGVPADAVRPGAVFTDDHGGWSYRTVIARAASTPSVRSADAETLEARWVRVEEVERLPLHPGFAATWQDVRQTPDRLVLVVDSANVIGAHPDGWWRDRAGALRRLRDRAADLAASGSGEGGGVPARALDGADTLRWLPEIVLVAEGTARGVPGAPGVAVLDAPGAGDDTIADVAAERVGSGTCVVVVTADRALAARCRAVGAQVRGPRWFDGLVGRPD